MGQVLVRLLPAFRRRVQGCARVLAELPADTEVSIISRGRLTGSAEPSSRAAGAHGLTLEGDVFAWIHGGDEDLHISIPLMVAIPAMVTSNFDKIVLFGGDEPVAREAVLPIQSSTLDSALSISFCSRLVEGEMAVIVLEGGVPGSAYALYSADELGAHLVCSLHSKLLCFRLLAIHDAPNDRIHPIHSVRFRSVQPYPRLFRV